MTQDFASLIEIYTLCKVNDWWTEYEDPTKLKKYYDSNSRMNFDNLLIQFDSLSDISST